MYKERISYHESVDEEHKKNLEQQVDVILKMEEERLILLKEHKESASKQDELATSNFNLEAEKQDLTKANAELQAKIRTINQELVSIREEVK